MELVALKLRSGEELIARVEENIAPSESITISKPRLVVPVNAGDGIRPMFMPWILSNPDGTYDLPKAHVAIQTKPVPEMENIYLQHTTSIALK